MSTHCLYRHFSVSGELLYVGITVDIPKRTKAHRKISEWFSDVATITISRFPDEAAARAAEEASIRLERPKFNLTHNKLAGTPTDKTELTTVTEVVEVLGGQSRLAKLLGVSQQAINNAIVRGNFNPFYFVFMLEELGSRGYSAPPALWRQRANKQNVASQESQFASA